MAFTFLSGFELGDTSEWNIITGTPVVATDQVTMGGYSLKSVPSATTHNVSTSVLNQASTFIRFNFFSNLVSTSGSQAWGISNLKNTVPIIIIEVVADTSGNLSLRILNRVTLLQVGSDVPIPANAWITVELKLVISPTVGVIELRVNGVVVVTSSTENTGSANITINSCGQVFTANANGTGAWWIDDVIISNSAYPGPGYSIARQGVAGTPTYDTWTKNGAATAALCWSETPFSATKNCSTVTASTPLQSMLLGSFSAAGNAQEGVGRIATVDTINAAKTAFIAKSSFATTTAMQILRRLSGVDTLTTITATASDAYYDDGIYTPTFANLTAATTEIGAKNTGTGAGTAQVEDMWLMVDYMPLGTRSPAARPRQQKRGNLKTRPKRVVRGNILSKVVPQPRPARIRPRPQAKRVPRVKAKRAVQGRVVHRIPPRPFPERPYPKARPQVKRVPRVKPKRAVKAGIIFRIPPRPFPEKPRLRPPPQPTRIPKVKAKRPLRGKRLLAAPIGLTRSLPRPRGQTKRLPRLRPKRALRTRILASPVVAPVVANLPLPILARRQTKRIPRVKPKRDLRSTLLQPQTAPNRPIPRPRPQAKRIPRVRASRQPMARLRITPPTIAPVVTALPLPIRTRAQPKRIPRVKAKRALSTRGIEATPTKRGLLPKPRPQRKRIARVTRQPNRVAPLHPTGVTAPPVISILPLPVRSRHGQRKRNLHLFRRHFPRFAAPLMPPTPPPPPVPFPITGGPLAPRGSLVALGGTAPASKLTGARNPEAPSPSGPRNPKASDKGTKTS